MTTSSANHASSSANHATNSAGPAVRVLLFGGTSEGNELACKLADKGVEVCVSVATDAGVKSVEPLMIGRELMSVRCGKMSTEDMCSLMREFDVVVDATHPYAVNISQHVAQCGQITGMPVLRVVRPRGDVEGCVLASSVSDAVSKIEGTGNVLSTTGSKEVSCYTALDGYKSRLYARVLDVQSSVDACRQIGLDNSHILAKRGPFSVEDNLADIDANHIETLVTKDGGNAGGYPQKLQAARMRGIRVIVVVRPIEENGLSVNEALEKIMERSFR